MRSVPVVLALRALFFAACVGVIWVSVLPADALVGPDLWDKLEHALAYGVLAFLGRAAYGGPRHPRRLLVGLGALGVGLEIAQRYVPGRVGDPADAFANVVGVVVGLGLATAFGLGRRSSDAKSPK